MAAGDALLAGVVGRPHGLDGSFHVVRPRAELLRVGAVVLIAGGKDKGFDFGPLRDVVKEKVHAAILLGEMAKRIAENWHGITRCEIARSLADAVERAHAAAKPGDVVLFSPGTSSFDMFKSYADRGDQFRRLVHALPR